MLFGSNNGLSKDSTIRANADKGFYYSRKKRNTHYCLWN